MPWSCLCISYLENLLKINGNFFFFFLIYSWNYFWKHICLWQAMTKVSVDGLLFSLLIWCYITHSSLHEITKWKQLMNLHSLHVAFFMQTGKTSVTLSAGNKSLSVCRFHSSTLVMLCILYPDNSLHETTFLSQFSSLAFLAA